MGTRLHRRASGDRSLAPGRTRRRGGGFAARRALELQLPEAVRAALLQRPDQRRGHRRSDPVKNRRPSPISRRQALLQLGSAGAGLLSVSVPRPNRGSDALVAVAAVSPRAIRLPALPAGILAAQAAASDRAPVADRPARGAELRRRAARTAVGESRVG